LHQHGFNIGLANESFSRKWKSWV